MSSQGRDVACRTTHQSRPRRVCAIQIIAIVKNCTPLTLLFDPQGCHHLTLERVFQHALRRLGTDGYKPRPGRVWQRHGKTIANDAIFWMGHHRDNPPAARESRPVDLHLADFIGNIRHPQRCDQSHGSRFCLNITDTSQITRHRHCGDLNFFAWRFDKECSPLRVHVQFCGPGVRYHDAHPVDDLDTRSARDVPHGLDDQHLTGSRRRHGGDRRGRRLRRGRVLAIAGAPRQGDTEHQEGCSDCHLAHSVHLFHP